MPREMTLEEMEKATAPGTAEQAFAQAASAAPAQELKAFEAPAGLFHKGEEFPIGDEIDLKEPEYDSGTIQGIAAEIREIGNIKQEAPKGALEELMALRMEFDAKLSHLMSQVSELKNQTSGPKLEGDVVMAQARVTVYCAECGVQLQGGAATAMANTPYVHPMGSAAPKPCSMVGVRFDMPWVYLKRLPAVAYKKALPA